jgi:acyl-CoA dehydrogenase
MTMGLGFVDKYNVERKFRETRVYQVAFVNNKVLAFLGQHVLGLPRSY